MCDGQSADDCDYMNRTEFETVLNDRLTELDHHFSTITDILNAKKEAFIKLYRKDPRKSGDKSLSRLQALNETFDPTTQEKVSELGAVENVEYTAILETEKTILCDSFSNGKNVVFAGSDGRRSVKHIGSDGSGFGYCFLNHPQIQKNKSLKWCLRVPKMKRGYVGIVIILDHK